jgi:DNA-binding MarR family transcriptional regulator
VRLSEWRVIDALHAGGEISANQISQWLMTDKAWVSRSVERLIEEGYVRRAADPGHGRRLLIRLTAKGERAYAAIAAAARQRNANLLECLTAAQQHTLRIALERLEARAATMLAAAHLGFEAMDEG